MRISFRKYLARLGNPGPLHGFFLFLIAWKLVSIWVGSPLILPAPGAILKALGMFITDTVFYRQIGATLVRGLSGFIIAVLVSLLIGIPSGINRTLRKVIHPVLLIIRSTPVISVILLALIWFSSDVVPVFVCFLMLFPVLCTNVIHGITNVDQNLIEMARVFELKGKKSLKYLYLPAIRGYLYSGMETAMGLTWKVVIAAEVLARPHLAIGSSMQEARVYLETAEVLAWTMMAVIISTIFDGILRRIYQIFLPGRIVEHD